MVAGGNDTQDWASDCNGEGRERVVRDGDSRMVMMAGLGQRKRAVADDGGKDR
jgi:hypothetical protein